MECFWLLNKIKMVKTKQIVIVISSLGILALIIFFSLSVINVINKFDDIQNELNANQVTVTTPITKVKNIRTGEQISLNLNQDSLFIHFWATYCKPCIAEFKTLNNEIAQNEEYNYFFISDEPDNVLKQFIANNNFQNITFYKIEKKVNPFNVEFYPTTFISNNKGNFTKIVGQYNWGIFFIEKKPIK